MTATLWVDAVPATASTTVVLQRRHTTVCNAASRHTAVCRERQAGRVPRFAPNEWAIRYQLPRATLRCAHTTVCDGPVETGPSIRTGHTAVCFHSGSHCGVLAPSGAETIDNYRCTFTLRCAHTAVCDALATLRCVIARSSFSRAARATRRCAHTAVCNALATLRCVTANVFTHMPHYGVSYSREGGT